MLQKANEKPGHNKDNKKAGSSSSAKKGSTEKGDDDDKYVYDFVKRFADEKRQKDSDVLDEYHRKMQ
jgi:hypothetical protein